MAHSLTGRPQWHRAWLIGHLHGKIFPDGGVTNVARTPSFYVTFLNYYEVKNIMQLCQNCATRSIKEKFLCRGAFIMIRVKLLVISLHLRHSHSSRPQEVPPRCREVCTKPIPYEQPLRGYSREEFPRYRDRSVAQ